MTAPTVSAPSALRRSPQQRAADPATSVWVAASAGTGKTRVLTDRVLRLLLDGTPPGRILCLTFTNAAAAEMANRVNERLADWATLADPALAASLADLVGGAPAPQQKLLASQLFARVLDAPDGIRIQTIHAFCQSLLARFPLEAGLAPAFTVMDERTALELFREAQDAVLARGAAAGAGDLTAAIRELSTHRRENDFFVLMAEFVKERGQLRDSLAAHGGLDATLARIGTRLDLEPGADETSVVAAACADAAFDGVGLGAAARAMALGSKSDADRGFALAAWLGEPAARVRGFDAYLELFFKGRGSGDRLARLATKAVYDRAPAAMAAFEKEADRLERVRARRRAIRLYRATAAALTVGEALLAAYDRAKRRRARLDYDDLIAYARRLLERPEVAPWVLYKLDGGIDHILIDEAQDTNPDQWRIVAALAEEFFAGLGARADTARTIFAVGDPKQSIFSFQRADPAAFSVWQRTFAERVAGARQHLVPVRLVQSYRSTEPILAAVDRVFAASPAKDGLDFDGRPIEHEARRRGHAGLVEVWPLEEPADAGDIQPWTPPVARESYRSPRAELANRIARQIERWLARDERLDSRGRAIAPGDIMVLVRQRSGFVAELVRALKKRNVAVAGSDRMILTAQLAVRDLIALGRFVLMPTDDLTLAVVLKSPLVGMSEDALFDVAWNRGAKPLWQALGERAIERLEFAAARRYLTERLAHADRVPPYAFFAEALSEQGGRRELVRRLGPQANDPIDEFLALALAFERSHVPSLEGFLHWLETGAVQVKRDHEHGRNEVRVMTVHGAKGLEAPIVFLADTVQVPREEPDLVWIDDRSGPLALWPPKREHEEALATAARAAHAARRNDEYRRLLYVAMTRAEDRLYVCGWRGTQAPEAGCWYNLIRQGLAGWLVEVPGPPGVTVARYATAQTAAPDQGEANPGSAQPLAAPAWLEQPAPAEPVPPRPLAPSRPADIEPPVRSPLDPAVPTPFLRGRLIHRLLERLPDLPAAARRPAAAAYLDAHAAVLAPAARAEIAAATFAVLDDPAFGVVFGPGSRAEVPIVGRLGAHVVAGQIDRLAIAEHAIAVVDYKSQRPAPRDERDVALVYLRQMAAYRAVLKKIYPDKSVACFLLWTDGPKLMRLADDKLDEIATGNFA